MNTLKNYIMFLNENVDPKVWEDIGYIVYTKPDGITHYAIDPESPPEAHHLASTAAQGDPQAINEIMGDYLTSED